MCSNNEANVRMAETVQSIVSTDLTKWRLKNERGRQTWWYDADGDFGRESNFIEMHLLGLDTVSSKISMRIT